MAFKGTIIKVLMLYFHGSLGNAIQHPPTVGFIGGHTVDIEDAPFMASLLEIRTTASSYMEEIKCGGTIIHEKFVLTTADCIKSMGRPIVVRVGSSQLFKGNLYNVEKYISHELYESRNTIHEGFDVGLLKLTEPLMLGPSVAMLKLADESFNISPGLNANVTAWLMVEKDFKPSQQLKQLAVKVSRHEVCDLPLFTDLQICIQTNYSRECCEGDTGGPVTVGDLQIGIVSRPSTCCGKPHKYVKVAPHLPWIQNNIEENLM